MPIPNKLLLIHSFVLYKRKITKSKSDEMVLIRPRFGLYRHPFFCAPILPAKVYTDRYEGGNCSNDGHLLLPVR